MADKADNSKVQHTLRVTLKGKDNSTYSGTLLIRNWTALAPPAPPPEEEPHQSDPTGASYYVIAVVLVYGFSIVMLIASHIKRKNAKLIEDKQINKYLQEFMIVKEKSSRDSYRHLKKSIVLKLSKERRPTYRTLSTTLFPVMAVALPPIQEQMDGAAPHMLQVPGGLRRNSSIPSGMLEYMQRSSRSGTPTPSEVADRPRHMSLPYGGDTRHGPIDRAYLPHHGSSDGSGDLEIDVPMLPRLPGSWRTLEDSIPELSESLHETDFRAAREKPAHGYPTGRLEELRPDTLDRVAEQALAHRVQTHPAPPSPSTRRTGAVPLARVYAATSPRAQAHMLGLRLSQGLPKVYSASSGEHPKTAANGHPAIHKPKSLLQHQPANSSPPSSTQASPVPSPIPSPTCKPRGTAEHPRQERTRKVGRLVRPPSPCASDSSDEQGQENVWLLIGNGHEHSPQVDSSPTRLGFALEGVGSRGSVSPLIKSSRETSPLHSASREGSRSRSTTPNRLSTPPRAFIRHGSPRRGISPRSLKRASLGSLEAGYRRSPSPGHSPKSPRGSPSPVSSETEHLLHVTVL